jgi:hypothetical protein
MTAGAVRWSCAHCEVSVGRVDGEPTELPETWTRSEGLAFCLSCSRVRAGDAALDAAPATSSREDRLRLRRQALIEFEIDRSPSAPDRTIALACKTSTSAVAAVRDELGRPATEASGPGARDDV